MLSFFSHDQHSLHSLYTCTNTTRVLIKNFSHKQIRKIKISQEISQHSNYERNYHQLLLTTSKLSFFYLSPSLFYFFITVKNRG